MPTPLGRMRIGQNAAGPGADIPRIAVDIMMPPFPL